MFAGLKNHVAGERFPSRVSGTADEETKNAIVFDMDNNYGNKRTK